MRANLANRHYRRAVTRFLLRVQANRCLFCDCWLARPDRPPPDPIPPHWGANFPTIDHMLPVSRGGDDRIDNLALTCPPCNLAKADRTAAEYFEYLGQIPR